MQGARARLALARQEFPQRGRVRQQLLLAVQGGIATVGVEGPVLGPTGWETRSRYVGTKNLDDRRRNQSIPETRPRQSRILQTLEPRLAYGDCPSVKTHCYTRSECLMQSQGSVGVPKAVDD